MCAAMSTPIRFEYTPMTTAHLMNEPAVSDQLLARAVVYRALGIGLDQPTQATHAGFCAGRAALQLAARTLEEEVDGPLFAAVERLLGLAPPGHEALRRSHERLFGHTLRGRVCPYECEYDSRAMLQQAHDLADLAGFYAAFGLCTGEGRHERPDHVACEVEFLEFLVRKECWALEHGDGEMAGTTRAAARMFLGDHLARFGRAFAGALQEAEPDGFYGALGELCETFLRLECERLDLPLGPKVLELCSTEPDGVPMACGSAGSGNSDELVQLGGGPPGARPTGSA